MKRNSTLSAITAIIAFGMMVISPTKAWALDTPNPTGPADGITNAYTRQYISWALVKDAGKYQLQMDTTLAFNSPLLRDVTFTTNSNQCIYDLHFHTHYYWRMRSISSVTDSVTSEWCAVRELTTLRCPEYVSPHNPEHTSFFYPTQTFRWKNCYGCTTYTIQTDTAADFSSPAKTTYTYTCSKTETSDELTKQIGNLYMNCQLYWRVKAANGADESEWSTTANFEMIHRAVASSPDELTNARTKQTLKWKYQTGLNHVIIELDTTRQFNSPIKRTINSSGSTQDYCYQQVSNLLFGTDYYWRLKAYHTKDTTQWSDILHFKTYNHCYLSTPADNATNRLVTLQLKYQYESDISSYQIQLDTTPTFSSPMLSSKLSSASSSDYAYESYSNLFFGQTYYWRVRLCHSADTSVWSETRQFTTYRHCNLDQSPSDSATNISTSPQLYFNYTSGISTYQLQLDTTPNFNSALLQTHLETASSQTYAYHSYSQLLYGTTYYRRVRECHPKDTSDWSPTRRFTTYRTGYFNTSKSIAHGATNVSRSPKLYVYFHSGIKDYAIELDTTNRFDSSLKQRLTLYTTSQDNAYTTPTKALLYGTTYYWRVKEKHAKDSSEWSGTRYFTTEYKKPAVTPVSPADKSIIFCDSATDFTWKAYPNGLQYQLQLSDKASFDSIWHTAFATDTTVKVPLHTNTTYYWRVQAQTPEGCTQWNDPRMLSTKDSASLYTLTPPILTHPATGITHAYTRQQFKWNAMEGAGKYVLQIDTTRSFASPELRFDTLTTRDITYYHFRFKTRYYWRVRALSATSAMELSRWSEVRDFTTDSQPELSSPSYDETGTGNYYPKQNFTWKTHFGCTSYALEMDTTADFSSPVRKRYTKSSYKTNEDTYHELEIGNLYLGKLIYWHVKALNDRDSSDWSVTYRFHTLNYAKGLGPDSITNAYTTQTLRWERLNGLPKVIIEIDTVKTFDSKQKRTLFSWAYYDEDANTEVTKLLFGTQYYWRIRYHHDKDTTRWSRTMEFKTYDFCTLNYPDNGAANRLTTGNVAWKTNRGIYYYQVQLDTTPQFNSGLLDSHIEWVATNDNPIYQYKNYRFGTTYYWRARECHDNDTSAWSETRHFSTYCCGVHGTSPADGATGLTVTPTLYIDYTTNISTYFVQLDTTPAFTSSLVRLQKISASTSSEAKWKVTDNLLYGTPYYWRVKDAHVKDTSEWSVPFVFTTTYQMSQPTLLLPLNQTVVPNDSATAFVWNTCEDAHQYVLQVASNGQFNPILHQELLSDTTTTMVLPSNSILYWRVQAINTLGRSPWSNIWGVNTAEIIPTALPNIPEDCTIQKTLRNGQLYIRRGNTWYNVLGL